MTQDDYGQEWHTMGQNVKFIYCNMEPVVGPDELLIVYVFLWKCFSPLGEKIML